MTHKGMTHITVEGANVHNLKNVSLTIPKHSLVVFTGLSGSGKSSLAFDTIFAEGQRRYMESLSSYARQFLHQLDKPDVTHIDGLSPAISIDQKSSSHNPRSTVATITEIYDYLRLLFASIGQAHCPTCKTLIQHQSIQEIVDQLYTWEPNTNILVLAPIIRDKKGTFKTLADDLLKKGFSRVMLNGKLHRLDEGISLEKNKKHQISIVVDRLRITPDNRSRLSESVETAIRETGGLLEIEHSDTHARTLFSESLSCPNCHFSLAELSHRLFSFNSPLGACPRCKGLGDILDFDPDLVVSQPNEAIRYCTGKAINLDGTYYGESLERSAMSYNFDLDTPYNDLSEEEKNIVLYGKTTAEVDDPYLKGTADDYQGIYGDWEGVMTNLRRRYYQTQSEGMRFFFRSYMSSKPCATCLGSRLKPEALAVTVNKKNIAELTRFSVKRLTEFFEKLPLTSKQESIVKQVLKEINDRLSFLNNVGLDYLTLNRQSGTLSGGEYQRIRLATQIGAGLTGVLYVLDEPSIGLHQRDNLKLIETLERLKNLGNTLIIVEHDEETILKADHVVDIGPGAGKEGGKIMFSGNVEALLSSKTSLTADYLSGRKAIQVPKKRRQIDAERMLTIHNAKENNLKNVTVSLPLGIFIAVTGVSGSGKSTLINAILHNALMRHFHSSKVHPGDHDHISGLHHIDKLITIDQSPIGRTPRSNPATYTGVFSPIRELFAQTQEAKMKGFKAGRFSFNVKGGRCEACEGDGVVKIEMHFLNDVYVECDICKGQRYNDQTLDVTFKGYTISDILKMSINDAAVLFENIPQISKKLTTLIDVGLGYIQVGQNATTLSGGEAQRIKLAKELSKRSTGKTLYLLDEPTTGLHFEDIQKLLIVLNRLVDGGNTVLVIEHNLDVIKTADHIIDLGPEGGEKGGKILAEGTPEKISKVKKSHTGRFLAPLLKKTVLK